MKVAFFTDPHLGLRRASHTSGRSQDLLRERLFDQCTAVFEAVAERELSHVICLGDLFDQFSNDEDTIEQGINVALQCCYVLAGNHDESNRKDVQGSLRLMSKIPMAGTRGEIVISPDPSVANYSTATFHDEVILYFVPHCLTQDLFIESLSKALEDFEMNKGANRNIKHVLCLHCNVGEGFGEVEGHGSTLWLTPDLQANLTGFDKILIGHEHTPKAVEPNIQVLGNTYPVSFGEIGDRFFYVYDSDTNELEAVQIFNAEQEHVEIDVAMFLDQQGQIEVSQFLVSITGTLKATEYAAFARSLSNFWKKNDHLYAVRKHVDVETAESVKTLHQRETKTLPELVKAAVADAGFEDELNSLESE